MEGEFEVGSCAVIKPKIFPTMRFHFIEIDPGRLLISEARMLGARLRHDHLVEPDGEETLIRNRIYLLGPTARFWGLLYGWRLRRSVRGFARRERELAEAA